MTEDISFSIRTLRFDESYYPAENTRATTNFANLARGAGRRENLRGALQMIDNRFNARAHWDNPQGDRYAVTLDIVTAEISIRDEADAFPVIEILKPTLIDRHRNLRIAGIAGNNFSSYLRDYDFSVLLPTQMQGQHKGRVPDDFGQLHGNIFKSFLNSAAYQAHFTKPPVICLSVSSSRTYHQLENRHPVLGVEYRQDEHSATDRYFAKMGLEVRFFMPPQSVAPLAFYFTGDLLNDYTSLELIGTLSVMESFQQIYRPEIYNANSAAGVCFRPSLTHQDYSLTRIQYDREERGQLAVAQGKYAEDSLIKPYGELLAQWSARHAA